MKRLYFFLLIGGLLMAACSDDEPLSEENQAATQGDTVTDAELPSYVKGINFSYSDWEEALRASKELNKPIFLDAYANWCRPCREMDKEVFAQTRVGDFYNENFINLKLDIDEGDGRMLSEEYEIMEIPAYLYFNSNGDLVHKTIGKRPVDIFIQDGKDALEKL
jgi:thiol:disulfide interchange protein